MLQKREKEESLLQAVPEVPEQVQQAPLCLFVALSVQQLIHNTVVVGDGELTALPFPVPGGLWMVNWLEEMALEQRQ